MDHELASVENDPDTETGIGQSDDQNQEAADVGVEIQIGLGLIRDDVVHKVELFIHHRQDGHDHGRHKEQEPPAGELIISPFANAKGGKKAQGDDGQDHGCKEKAADPHQGNILIPEGILNETDGQTEQHKEVLSQKKMLDVFLDDPGPDAQMPYAEQRHVAAVQNPGSERVTGKKSHTHLTVKGHRKKQCKADDIIANLKSARGHNGPRLFKKNYTTKQPRPPHTKRQKITLLCGAFPANACYHRVYYAFIAAWL